MEKSIVELKKEYLVLQKKYGLPGFEELNRDFSVEKIAESETEILIREVRKSVGDKLMGYMRFIENLINPTNAPMFIFSIIKLIEPEEKKKLGDIYKELMKKEMKFIELDLDFNEIKEAEFIKDSFKFWQATKKEMLSLVEKINDKWDDKSEANNKGYFG